MSGWGINGKLSNGVEGNQAHCWPSRVSLILVKTVRDGHERESPIHHIGLGY